MNGVSIIICCYNSAERIVSTLQHLQLQEFNNPLNWEVIVIDNASNDATMSIALEIWNQNPVTDFFIFREEKSGLMNARHRGCKEAKYEIVSFIDDDNWVEKRWVQKVWDLFSIDSKIGACGGKNEAIFENSSPEWFHLFENSFAVGKQADESGIVNEKKGFLWGAGLSFKKSIWEDLQKRNYINLTLDREGKTLSSGGDTELCYAIRLMGYQLYYKDDLSLKHYMPANRMKFSYLEKMAEGFGKANVKLNYYRVLLYSDFKLYPWWYEWLSATKKVIEKFFVSILARNEQIRWDARVKKAYWKGYASQMWQDKALLNKYIASLISVFPSKRS